VELSLLVGAVVEQVVLACFVPQLLAPTSGKPRISHEEIKALVGALGNICSVIADADPAGKAGVNRQLGLKLTYRPGKRTVGAEIALGAQS
jgi:hypothetical protein